MMSAEPFWQEIPWHARKASAPSSCWRSVIYLESTIALTAPTVRKAIVPAWMPVDPMLQPRAGSSAASTQSDLCIYTLRPSCNAITNSRRYLSLWPWAVNGNWSSCAATAPIRPTSAAPSTRSLTTGKRSSKTWKQTGQRTRVAHWWWAVLPIKQQMRHPWRQRNGSWLTWHKMLKSFRSGNNTMYICPQGPMVSDGPSTIAPRDGWLTDELLLICPQLAEDMEMPRSANRTMVGMLWGPCDNASLNGNHPAIPGSYSMIQRDSWKLGGRRLVVTAWTGPSCGEGFDISGRGLGKLWGALRSEMTAFNHMFSDFGWLPQVKESAMAIATMADSIMSNPPPEGSAHAQPVARKFLVVYSIESRSES